MNNIYSIGEVSKLMNIPIKALHIYEKKGLIKPFYTNPLNGYRYYRHEQFFKIDVIRHANKKLNISLTEIREMLFHEDSKESLLQILEKKKDDTYQIYLDYKEMIQNLELTINFLKNSNEISIFHPVIKQFEKRDFYYLEADPDQDYEKLHCLLRNIVMPLRKEYQKDEITLLASYMEQSPQRIGKAGFIWKGALPIKEYRHDELPAGTYLCLSYMDYEKNSETVEEMASRYANEQELLLSKERYRSWTAVDITALKIEDVVFELQIPIELQKRK